MKVKEATVAEAPATDKPAKSTESKPTELQGSDLDDAILNDLQTGGTPTLDDEEDKEETPKPKAKTEPKEDDDDEGAKLRHADYTKKMQEVSEERKELEALRKKLEESQAKPEKEESAVKGKFDAKEVLDKLGLDYSPEDIAEQLDSLEFDPDDFDDRDAMADKLNSLANIMTSMLTSVLHSAAMVQRGVQQERQVAANQVVESIGKASDFIKAEYGTELTQEEAVRLLRAYKEPLALKGHKSFSPQAIVDAWTMHNAELASAKKKALDKAHPLVDKAPTPAMRSSSRGGSKSENPLTEDEQILADLSLGQ